MGGREYAALLFLALVWSASFTLIKVAVVSVPPLSMAVGWLLLAVAVLAVLPTAIASLVYFWLVLGPRAAHVTLVAVGVPGTPMHAFGGEPGAEGPAAITTFPRNAFGHGTGGVVQPPLAARLQ